MPATLVGTIVSSWSGKTALEAALASTRVRVGDTDELTASDEVIVRLTGVRDELASFGEGRKAVNRSRFTG